MHESTLPYLPKGIGPWSLLFAAILLRALTQILFKFIALASSDSLTAVLLFWPTYLALLLLFFRALTWQQVLVRFPLSIAFPFTGLTFISLLISGSMFFDESITLENIFGIVLILLGLNFIGMGAFKELQ